jgi:hypothetical protein
MLVCAPLGTRILSVVDMAGRLRMSSWGRCGARSDHGNDDGDVEEEESRGPLRMLRLPLRWWWWRVAVAVAIVADGLHSVAAGGEYLVGRTNIILEEWARSDYNLMTSKHLFATVETKASCFLPVTTMTSVLYRSDVYGDWLDMNCSEQMPLQPDAGLTLRPDRQSPAEIRITLDALAVSSESVDAVFALIIHYKPYYHVTGVLLRRGLRRLEYVDSNPLIAITERIEPHLRALADRMQYTYSGVSDVYGPLKKWPGVDYIDHVFVPPQNAETHYVSHNVDDPAHAPPTEGVREFVRRYAGHQGGTCDFWTHFIANEAVRTGQTVRSWIRSRDWYAGTPTFDDIGERVVRFVTAQIIGATLACKRAKLRKPRRVVVRVGGIRFQAPSAPRSDAGPVGGSQGGACAVM